MVQERALTALASSADSSQERFQKYYDAVMPYLKISLMNATDKSKRMLCAKSMECISLVGMAVGKDRFRDDARQLMEVLMSLQGSQREANDPITSYMLQAWARLCKCLGQDFLPYMSAVMPPLLQSAQLKSDVIVTSADSEDEAEDSDDEAEDSDDESMETINLGDKRIGIKTSGLDAGFFPWIDQVAPTLVPLLKFYFHEEVGRAAVSEALSRLNVVIQQPNARQSENAMAYDNALSAVGKIYQFHRDSIDSSQVLPVCLNWKPNISNDVIEAKVVHDQLCLMVERVVPNMSDLPSDLEEEVLTRLPVTSLGKLRLTCKKWNTLTKGGSFLKKQRKGIEMVMLLDHRFFLMSVDLLYPSIERIGNLDADGVDISKAFHCNGLFLCITKDKDKDSSRLVVWNPYLGQTRWIEPSNSYHRFEKYALGYDEENKHKVLRFVIDILLTGNANQIFGFEVYRLNSNSWKVIDDFVPDWRISFKHSGLSLKGNTYWYAQEQFPLGYSGRVSPDHPDFLVSFDFTTERFGPHLHLPFHAFFNDTVTLSSLRQEQLVVLFRKVHTSVVKIWITNKIEPNAVSWNNMFLAVDMKPLIMTNLHISNFAGSFFVDEEKKVAVVLGKDRDTSRSSTRNNAYIIGDNRCFKKVVLGESLYHGCYPFVCSYVPSSTQIRNTP